MMKLLVTVAMLLVSSCIAQAQVLDSSKIKRGAVEYVTPDKLKKFPVPTLIYVRDKPEHEALKKEINEKIIYPMLCESAAPIATIIIDFCPEIIVTGADDERGCQDEAEGKLTFAVKIRHQDGLGFQAFIQWDKETGIDEDTYLMLFQDGYDEYVPKRNCKNGNKAKSSK